MIKFFLSDDHVDRDRMITLPNFFRLISDLETEEKKDFEGKILIFTRTIL